MTDDELIRRVLHGELAVFDRLVDRHGPSALRFATRMLGDQDDAEEVTQDAWVRAYRALARYDAHQPFRTWLFAILINRCRSAMLIRARRERRFRLDAAALQNAEAAAPTDDAALRVELQRAIDHLPAEQREAFLLKHVEQMEYGEMSEIVGASISALKMRVQRACQQLRVELRDHRDG